MLDDITFASIYLQSYIFSSRVYRVKATTGTPICYYGTTTNEDGRNPYAIFTIPQSIIDGDNDDFSDNGRDLLQRFKLKHVSEKSNTAMLTMLGIGATSWEIYFLS